MLPFSERAAWFVLCQVYQASTETFLPTPVKSHYLFNMRDVAKVIEGVMQVRHSVLFGATQTVDDAWLHAWHRLHGHLCPFGPLEAEKPVETVPDGFHLVFIVLTHAERRNTRRDVRRNTQNHQVDLDTHAPA